MTTRTDIHRPSAIDPSEYEFVGVEHIRMTSLFDCACAQQQRKVIESHMKRTGGTYSSHEHGGNCQICGAHCHYTALFYHPSTNVYIRTGFDCAENMSIGDKVLFRRFHTEIQDALKRKAGKAKAQVALQQAGVEKAWDVYESREELLNPNGSSVQFEESAIIDIVWKLVKYGSLSEKQLRFVDVLLNKIEKRAELQAQREAEKANAADVPESDKRWAFEGVVLKTKYQQSQYGEQLKMLVKADEGYTLWGTVPSSLQLVELNGIQRGLERGDRVRFTARISRSDSDSKFGFFSRPSQATLCV